MSLSQLLRYFRISIDSSDIIPLDMDNSVVHLSRNGRVWDVDTQGPWISKTDLVEFELCRYRYYLAHQQGKAFREFRNASSLRLLESGHAHELSAASNIGIIDSPDIDAARTHGGLFKIRTRFYNHDYGMVGELDCIWFENDVLCPVEIKSHSKFRPMDRQELAFYWRLLEPVQPRKVPKENRRGYVFLGQSIEPKKVSIRPEDITESEFKVIRARNAISKEPELSLSSECKNCTLEEDHKVEVKERLSLDVIYGVGRQRKEILRQLGINTLGDLATSIPEVLASQWSKFSPYQPALYQLVEMKTHAESWLSGKPRVLDATQIPTPSEAIILDLEYSPGEGGSIFLAGMLVSGNEGATSVIQEFSENSLDERRVLESLIRVLNRYPTYPIVTWAGLSADFPQLQKAWLRHSLPRLALDDFKRRHVDLFKRTERGIRLPILKLGLKEVSDYFRFKRKATELSSGFDALSMYQLYLTNGNDTLKSELKVYNQDDLASTLFIWHKLWECANQFTEPRVDK